MEDQNQLSNCNSYNLQGKMNEDYRSENFGKKVINDLL